MGVEVVAFNIFVEHRRLANAMLAEQFGNEGLLGGFHQTFFPVTAIVEITGKQKKTGAALSIKVPRLFSQLRKANQAFRMYSTIQVPTSDVE